MSKLVNIDKIKHLFRDDMTILAGGFIGCGSPEILVDLIMELDIKNLTLIANDTAFPEIGIGKLIVNNQVKKVIASHIGTNPYTGNLMSEGKMEVELSPQGSLIERIRAGGSGLGGVLTRTGLGTKVEEGKQIVNVNGTDFLLELPIRADLAIVKGNITDELGNTFYRGTARNFNPIIALAADTVIMESDEIVKPGEITPENVMTPGVLVDYIVKGGK